MVGEGVLKECLEDENVEAVLIINRKPSGFVHPKLKEIIHKDFYNLQPVASQLAGYNACYFCLGVTSLGKREPEYYRLTYTLTMHFAETVASRNPGMVFCYVSGAHTDSSENGRLMWARVKGKTENDLQKLPFKAEYNFRPSILKPSKGAKNVLAAYKFFSFLYPVVKGLLPNYACSLKELGQAMLQVTTNAYPKAVLEVKDIINLAKQKAAS
jgi:hypothetical protein